VIDFGTAMLNSTYILKPHPPKHTQLRPLTPCGGVALLDLARYVFDASVSHWQLPDERAVFVAFISCIVIDFANGTCILNLARGPPPRTR
jgi:hypothetical protein